MTRLSSRRRRLVRSSDPPSGTPTPPKGLPIGTTDIALWTDEKARKELAAKAGGKGPLNTGGQGIKKSGKK